MILCLDPELSLIQELVLVCSEIVSHHSIEHFLNGQILIVFILNLDPFVIFEEFFDSFDFFNECEIEPSLLVVPFNQFCLSFCD